MKSRVALTSAVFMAVIASSGVAPSAGAQSLSGASDRSTNSIVTENAANEGGFQNVARRWVWHGPFNNVWLCRANLALANANRNYAAVDICSLHTDNNKYWHGGWIV